MRMSCASAVVVKKGIFVVEEAVPSLVDGVAPILVLLLLVGLVLACAVNG
jgi:hypothetical protein